jgi:chromosome segregation ATPase
MGRIQTGVDRLVTLLHEQKKITVDDAAKALGVSKAIVQEWADFLEEEGLLDIKYSLSKTYLTERQLSKHEVEQKEKQFADQRETFIRRVDTAIAQLENETASFENFKKEFNSIKGEMGSELETIQKEFDQLKQYESLKAQVAEDLEKQHAAFQKQQQEADTAIKHQYKQYEDVLHAIGEQEKKLLLEKKRVQELIASEQSVTQKLTEYSKLLDQLKSKTNEETSQLGADEQMLNKLQKVAVDFKSTLESINKNNLQPLQQMRIEHDQRVAKLEQQILAKAAGIDKAVKDSGTGKVVVKKKLEEFFGRKKDIEKLLTDIEKDKVDLLGELKELQDRAEAYRLGKTSVRFEELESKMQIIEERKKGLRAHIVKFLRLLH